MFYVKGRGEGGTPLSQPNPLMIETDRRRRPTPKENSLSTLSISAPLPTGPGKFDAAAFTANALSSPENLAGVLDHTLLKPDATRVQVLELCHEAAHHRFACAMVNPTWVHWPPLHSREPVFRSESSSASLWVPPWPRPSATKPPVS